ncbi:MAG: hypothetical protein U1F43_14720 [Myxococcota bacterium]
MSSTDLAPLALAAALATAGCAPSGPPVPGVPSLTLPLQELSGLAVSGGSLFGVGDASAKLAVMDLASRTARAVSLPLPHHAAGSQLEGVAIDAAGRVWALEEEPGAVYVLALDGDAATLLHTFHIVVPSGDPLHAAWKADANARGEGLALMAHGHVLVAKQRHPVRLIELGPAGDDPLGLPAPPLPGDALALPGEAASDLVPLAEWAPADDAATARIADISDLSADPSGVWILAGRSHLVARLALPLDPASATFAATDLRPLPTPIDGLVFEGLAFDGLGHALLGVDRKGRDPNVAVLPWVAP